jgi:hypothetical protein
MFDKPIRLLRVGIGYDEPPGAGPGFINIAGARNGLSIDAAKFVVLGQDIGEAGSPAKLLNNREIPDEGFYLNKWGAGGSLILTDVASVGVVGSKMYLQNSGDNLQLITGDIIEPVHRIHGRGGQWDRHERLPEWYGEHKSVQHYFRRSGVWDE